MKKEGLSLKKTAIILIILAILVIILYFGKEIYCKPSGYLPNEREDTESKKLQNFFKDQNSEILCTGSNEELNKIFSGKTNYIVCRTNSIGQSSIEITKANALKSTSSEVNGWIKDRKWEGSSSASAIFQIQIPEGVNEESLRLEIVIRKEGQLVSTENLNFEIYKPTPMMEKVCNL